MFSAEVNFFSVCIGVEYLNFKRSYAKFQVKLPTNYSCTHNNKHVGGFVLKSIKY